MLIRVLALIAACLPSGTLWAELRAGAVALDITPQQYPVLINGGMTSNSANAATTPIHARAIVMESGQERIAMVVVDSCMMSRTFLDEVKALANMQTGIPKQHIMISATHAHSVPASMGCLGTDADEAYIPYLRIKLVEAIEKAITNLEPARIGFASASAANYTAVRHWIRRPDRMVEDAFGNKTVRANMHAGRAWDDVIGEATPEDPALSLLSIQAIDGRPIAVLGNFSMHYFSGEKPVSADYFGLFSEGLKERLAVKPNGDKPNGDKSNGDKPNSDKPAFVGIMSHGCSGDIWRMDYTKQTPARFETIKVSEYTDELLDIATEALKSIKYDDQADLAMEETRLLLKYRVPDKQRLEWARAIVEKMGDRLPKTTEEVYAREQLILHERQQTSIVVQAIRIGSIAIATTPTETYALTGLKIKLRSPLKQTMVIELANGGDGYIPPPEQHVLGGYNTWAARSAGLEIEAEPQITEAAINLLERVSGKDRSEFVQSRGEASQRVLASKPLAYYRLDEMEGPRAVDSSGNNLDGIYEPGVVFFLEGAASKEYCRDGEVNRAAQFAGGRMQARVPGLGDRYSITMWIWNGMPIEGRDMAGWFFGRGHNHDVSGRGDSLGLIGQGPNAGKLAIACDNKGMMIGKSIIPRWTWTKVQFVREGSKITLTLNDGKEPEIQAEAPFTLPLGSQDLFFGGRGNRESSWEGRLDEIVVEKR